MNYRAKSLMAIINSKFGGKQADFCRATGIRTTQANQWLVGYRNMGEKAARNIESILGLSKGSMDSPELLAAGDVVVQNDAPKIFTIGNDRYIAIDSEIFILKAIK